MVVPLIGLFALALGFLPLSGPVASAGTTPTPKIDFPQCANDTFTGNSGDCNWVNGDLNANNSTYAEGESTVQAVDITKLLPGSSHTLVIDYQTTKNSLHGYDFLTSWNWSELPTNLCDVMAGPGCTQTGTNAPAGTTTAAIPSDPNVPNSFQNPIARPARVFTMLGGTLDTVSTPTVVSGSFSGGAYSATSVTEVSVSFTVASVGVTTCGHGGNATCEVALWFGAHISLGLDWGNSGIGAGGISGSPYHVSLVTLDTSPAGSQDNQLKVDFSKINGTVVINKTAVPLSSQLFNFTMANGTSTVVPFQLTGDATASSSQSYSVPPDTWTITEGTNPSGWQLTALACKNAAGADVGTTSVATGVATLDVASEAVITCTYTDSQQISAITITKAPSNQSVVSGSTATWTITVTNSGDTPLTNVSVTDTLAPNCDKTFTGTLAAGASETAYTCSLTNVTAGFTNVAVASAYGPGEEQVTDQSQAVVTLYTPPVNVRSIGLAKSASPTTYAAAGQTITYTYVITNTGNVNLASTQYSVSDDHINSGTAFNCGSPVALNVGASVSCTATYTVTAADVTAGSVTNAAIASGGGLTTAPAHATIAKAVASAITLAKSASPTTYTAVGDVITYTYVITNTGNVELASTQYSVSDDHINSGTAFSCGSPVALAAGATVTCTANYTITAADMAAGSVTNSATASGGGLSSAPVTATVTETGEVTTTQHVSPPTVPTTIPNNGPATGAGGAASSGGASVVLGISSLVLLAGLALLGVLFRRRRS
ncbi:MAG TPA: hypothetical protein VMV53_04125 [Acidimicrobiales bacterium]|nr:hypothetical protein [Acidimicrobiales bacterium]